jgi:ubiquinone/menaquinone biosynthesis C-methylase UbiE
MSSPESQKRRAIETHSEQADEFASAYRDLAQDPHGSCFTYSRRRLADRLDRLLSTVSTGRRLLDVGCGTGHHLSALQQRGFDVCGIDGSADMLAQARALNPTVELKLADVDALPVPDASFDVVICIEVLRYLPDPTRCIREIARVLRPGGMALVTAQPLLNLNGYFAVNRFPLKRFFGLVPLKQFFTTSGRLRRQFRRAGFDTVKIHGVYIGPINWIEHLAQPILRRTLKAWEPLDARLADRPVLRELANMFLVHATRAPAP